MAALSADFTLTPAEKLAVESVPLVTLFHELQLKTNKQGTLKLQAHDAEGASRRLAREMVAALKVSKIVEERQDTAHVLVYCGLVFKQVATLREKHKDLEDSVKTVMKQIKGTIGGLGGEALAIREKWNVFKWEEREAFFKLFKAMCSLLVPANTSDQAVLQAKTLERQARHDMESLKPTDNPDDALSTLMCILDQLMELIRINFTSR